MKETYRVIVSLDFSLCRNSIVKHLNQFGFARPWRTSQKYTSRSIDLPQFFFDRPDPYEFQSVGVERLRGGLEWPEGEGSLRCLREGEGRRSGEEERVGSVGRQTSVDVSKLRASRRRDRDRSVEKLSGRYDKEDRRERGD